MEQPRVTFEENIITPPPLARVIEPLREENADYPGETFVDEHGRLLKRYLDYQGFTKFMINAYNHWVTNTMGTQMSTYPITLKSGDVIYFTGFTINPPTYTSTDQINYPDYPNKAINTGRTYSANIFVNLELRSPTNTVLKSKDNLFMFKLPVMVGSQLDNLIKLSPMERLDQRHDPKDPNGWFVINGAEKIVLLLEKLRANRPLLYYDSNELSTVAKYTCSTIKGSRVITLSVSKRYRSIRLNLQFLGKGKNKDFPVFSAFKLLGEDNTDQMLDMVLKFVKPEARRKALFALQSSFMEVNSVNAVDYIAKLMGIQGTSDPAVVSRIVTTNVSDDLFPQIPSTNRTAKLQMLSILIARLVESMVGARAFDDRDSWSNKRIDSAAKSMEQLFMGLWTKTIDNVNTKILEGKVKSFEDVVSALSTNTITDEFISSFTSNNWGVKEKYNKENITDILKRDNLIATYSHLLRITISGSSSKKKKTKSPHIREVQQSGTGIICPAETTEGEGALEISTIILMKDGSYKPIGELKDGDEVVSVDPETFEMTTSPITNYFKKPASELGLLVYKITTMSGRDIVCTEDHPFLTNEGWVETRNLDQEKHLLVIKPSMTPVSPVTTENQLVLDTTMFKTCLEKAEIKPSLISKHTEDLIKLGFLPLYSNDPKLQVLARITGFCSTDGCLSINSRNHPESKWCFGSNEDANMFEDDMELLGYERSSIYYKTTTREVKQTFSSSTYNTSHGGSFASLLIALGVTYGKNIEKESNPVPEWVMNGSMVVKRNYLSGIQGGDGSRIQWNKDRKGLNSCRFTLLGTRIYKAEPVKESLVEFMKQLEQLFNEFGVKTLGVTCSKSYDDRYLVELRFNEEQDNLVRYMDNIEYAYCNIKQGESLFITEYIKYRKNVLKERLALKQKVVEMYESGKGPMEISKLVGISYNEARSITQQYNKEGTACFEKISLSTNVIPMTEWLQKCTYKNNTIYVPIKTIEQVKEDTVVADFTTLNENHSFIAKDFVTHNCGITKNLAVTAYISVDNDDPVIFEIVRKFLSADYTEENTSKCMFNGIFVGWCAGETMRDYLIQLRRSGALPFDMLIKLDKDGFLYLYTDGSRPVRPLLIVDRDNRLVIEKKKLWNAPFDELVREGAVEYLDPFEQEDSYIAQSIWDMQAKAADKQRVLEFYENAKEVYDSLSETDVGNYVIQTDREGVTKLIRTKADALMVMEQAQEVLEAMNKRKNYTHCELDPQAIMGLSASIMPMPERAPAPRVTYQAGMQKQALGIYHSNYLDRFDTTAKLLAYPTRPMFETQLGEYLEFKGGQNVIMAFMTLDGFNQEDAIIFNQTAIDNGLFTIIKYSKYMAVEKQSGDVFEEFGRPPIPPGQNVDKYAALDENGFPMVGAYVKEGDYIIGRIRRNIKTKEISNASIPLSIGETGVIDKVLVSTNAQSQRVVKVRIRDVRSPEQGDKFASRYAQKGVIGRIVPADDMPFNEDGMSPDIIVNPHAIPSRMTVGKLIEIVASKHAAFKGEKVDATAFRAFDLDKFRRTLRGYGYNQQGYEKLRSGTTGLEIDAEIYMGPCYYQALRHHVKDKIQMRDRGAVRPLTHTPVPGRFQRGGQKYGEMEKNSIVSHGAAALVPERLCRSSDAYTTVWCQTCGTMAIHQVISREFVCRKCGGVGNFGKVTTPYTFKVLTQYLSGIGINVTTKLVKESEAKEPGYVEPFEYTGGEGEEGDYQSEDDSGSYASDQSDDDGAGVY